MILEDVKTLLGITGDEQDDVLSLHIRRALNSIEVHLNHAKYTPEVIETRYPDAVVAMVVNGYRSDNSPEKGVKSMSQGSRSVTYMDDKWATVDKEVSAMLPTPFIGLR